MERVKVVVHRCGKTFVRRNGVLDVDGKVYIRHNDRWWMLSREVDGWRSVNVAPCDPVLLARLDMFASSN